MPIRVNFSIKYSRLFQCKTRVQFGRKQSELQSTYKKYEIFMRYVKKYKFINSIIHSIIRLFVCLFVRSFVLSFFLSFFFLFEISIPYLKRFDTVLIGEAVGVIP